MCVCVCVCAYQCMCMCVSMCVYKHVCARIHVPTSECVHVCAQARTCQWIWTFYSYTYLLSSWALLHALWRVWRNANLWQSLAGQSPSPHPALTPDLCKKMSLWAAESKSKHAEGREWAVVAQKDMKTSEKYSKSLDDFLVCAVKTNKKVQSTLPVCQLISFSTHSQVPDHNKWLRTYLLWQLKRKQDNMTHQEFFSRHYGFLLSFIRYYFQSI